MRIYASFGALTGIAWLASAAAVPRNDIIETDSTCTSTLTEQATVFVTLDPGSLGSASGSSSCSETPTGQPGEAFSGTTAHLSASQTPLPVSPEGSVVTVTIPEGPSSTATVVLTVTVPEGSPGSWSTIITAPGAGPVVTVTLFSTPLSGPTTRVPVPVSSVPISSESLSDTGSSWFPLTIETITVSLDAFSSPTTGQPSSPSAPGVSSSCSTPLSAQLVTYTILPSGTSSGYTAVFTLTQPLQTISTGFQTISTALATVTVIPVTIPVPSSPGQGSQPPGSMISPLTITIPAATVSVTLSTGLPTPSAGSLTGSTGPVTVSQGFLTTVTIPQAGSGQPGTVTLTVPEVTVSGGSSPSNTGVQPGVITVTVLKSTASISLPTPSSPGSGALSTQTGSIVVVTYTIPGGSGVSPSLYTVTYTELPSATGFESSSSALTGQSPTLSPPDEYGTSFSSSTPQFSQSVETITIGGSEVSSQSIGLETVSQGVRTISQTTSQIVETITVSPNGASGTPFVVTYTPSATVSHALETISQGVETVTIFGTGGILTSSGGTPPLTITVVPAGGSGSPVIITYTPEVTVSSSVSSVSTVPTPVVVTVFPTDTSGTPVIVTYTPDVTVSSSVSSISNLPTPVVVTVFPTDTSGTPFVFTYTPTETIYPSVASVTTGFASVATGISSPGYGGGGASSGSVSPAVITVTPSSGSPFVVTISENTISGTLSGPPAVSTVIASVPSTPAGSSSAGASPTVFTLSMSSGPPLVVTISGNSAVSTTQASVVTITEGASSTSGSTSPSGSAITIPQPSGSPIVVTIPTSNIPQTISTIQPGVLTVTTWLSSTTTGASSPGGSVITVTPQTVLVSEVTLTETVPIGSGESTVVELTTELTITGSASTRLPAIVTVSPVVVTYTLSSAYDHGSTILTYTTDLPVGSTVTSPGGVSTLTLTASASGYDGSSALSHLTGLPVASTITSPGGVTTLTLTASASGYDGSGPGVVASQSNSDAAAAQSNSATPSEITIWPTPSSTSDSCTTLLTIYRPSSTTSRFDPATSAQFTVITLSLASDSAAQAASHSSTCTETPEVAISSSALSIANTASEIISTTSDSISTTSDSTSTTAEPSDASAEPSDVFPPPQTEVANQGHGHTTRGDDAPLVITIVASSTLAGYVFSSPDGYGNPVPGYGTPVSAVTSSATILASLTQPGLPTVESTPGSNATVPAITTISAEPAATSTSLALPVPGQNTTLPTQSGIVPSIVVPSSDSIAPTATVPGSVTTSILATLPSGWSLSTQSPTDTVSASDSVPALSSVAQSPTAALSTLGGQLPTSSDTTLPTALNSTAAPLPAPLSTSVPTADIFTSGVAPLSGTAASSQLLSTVPASTSLAATSVAPLNGTSIPSSFSVVPSSSLATTLPATSAPLTVTSVAPLNETAIPSSLPTTPSSPSAAPSSLATTPSATGAAPLNGTSIPSSLPATPSGSLTTTLPATSASLVATSAAPLNGTATPPSLPSTVSSTSLGSPTCGAAGDRGEVVFNFDDIPSLSFGNDSSFPPQPVPFPYHRFFFSEGFHVATQQTSKYEPSSPSQLVQYNISASPIGQIGLAQLRENPCFRFDLLGIGLGCNSTDLPCVFGVTGLQWNGAEEVVQANRTFEIAACPDTANCTLSHQVLDSAAASTFTNLTAINITLTVANEAQTWWADDLQVAWTDNDCNTAGCRSRVPNTIMFLHKPSSLRRNAYRRRN